MEPLYLLPFPGSKAKHYLLYTGQHYDPLVGAASPETSVDDEVCLAVIKKNACNTAKFVPHIPINKNPSMSSS